MNQNILQLTFNVFHDHAQVSPGLKGAVHGHHERVLSKSEDVSLYKGLLDLVPQHQVLLIDLFHGKPLLCVLVANQVNSPVGGAHCKTVQRESSRASALLEPHSLSVVTWNDDVPVCTIADEFYHLKVQFAGFSPAPQCCAEA